MFIIISYKNGRIPKHTNKRQSIRRWRELTCMYKQHITHNVGSFWFMLHAGMA